MQDIILEKPYRFVPPHPGRFWHGLLGLWLPHYLRRDHGLCRVECRGRERLEVSLSAGHGILLAPNHCRPCDPMVLGMLSRELHQPFFVMASRHLFEQGRFQKWYLRRAGAFSVYREGLDREALKAAIEILRDAIRPLVLFPEGTISRTNDRLNNLMEGTAFIARSAAKQRASATPPGRVVVHPVAIRYRFDGDVDATLTPVLEEIERRLSLSSGRGQPLEQRIRQVGLALLEMKEVERLGRAQTGTIPERLRFLIEFLLAPLENEWLQQPAEGDVVARVKRLRLTIVPDLVGGGLDEEERARRWRQLADLYLAQQLSNYPPDYVRSSLTPERLVETVERFEEDLTDTARVHRSWHAIIHVGEAISVEPKRDRTAESDPLMEEIRSQIESMLHIDSPQHVNVHAIQHRLGSEPQTAGTQ
jgi:1-acyl-sn-glycerol-3-phosphate acyltransferase